MASTSLSISTMDDESNRSDKLIVTPGKSEFYIPPQSFQESNTSNDGIGVPVVNTVTPSKEPELVSTKIEAEQEA